MTQQTYFCRAEAEAAAQKLRALPSAYHQVDVVMEDCPQYGTGGTESAQATADQRPDLSAEVDPASPG